MIEEIDPQTTNDLPLAAPSGSPSVRPRCKLPNGKTNPAWQKWYRQQRPDIVKKWNSSDGFKRATKKYRDKMKPVEAEKRHRKRTRSLKSDGHLRRKVQSMLKDGWKEETIVMVLQVPQSVVREISENDQVSNGQADRNQQSKD
jgi:hypothetical protein